MVAERATDSFIEQIAAELRRPVRFDGGFDDRVMAALDAPDVIPLHPHLPARRPWFARPLTFRASPIALATAAGLLAVLAIGLWRTEPVQQVRIATNTAEPGNLIPVAASDGVPLVLQQFTFYQKGLESVAIAGQFNNWDEKANALTQVSDGVWTISLPLRPGMYEYQFILNGERRVTDPTMPQVPSDFGSPNSVITVSARER